MKISIDIKSLLAGFILAAVVFLVIGAAYSGAGKADFAIALDRTGLAIMRANDGTIYTIDPQNRKAEIIEYRDGPNKGRAVNINRALIDEKSKKSTKKY